MFENPINLTTEELYKLKEKGHGSDGSVRWYDNKHLIKVYHTKLKKLLNPESVSLEDDEELKTYEIGKNKIQNNNFENMFLYYKSEDNGEIRIRSEEAIKLAMQKQSKVKYTRLPQNAVYINGRFAGCLILASKGLQIHKLTGYPLKWKKKIMLEVIRNVRELLDNYIYHIDLDNSPYAVDSWFEGNLVGHSHVLVNPITLKPQIIDLDGKSTIYRESYNKDDEYLCLTNLTRLVIEFLLSIDLNEYSDQLDLEYELEHIGVKAKYINDLVCQHMDIKTLEEFVNDVDLKRK